MRTILLGLSIILFSSLLMSQEKNQDTINDFKEVRKNAVSFNFFGTTPIIGITYERAFSRYFSIEAGFGLPLGIGAGLKIIPWGIKESKLLFHFGLTVTYINTGDNEFTGTSGVLTYIPVGISLYEKRGFNFGFDIGPGFYRDSSVNHFVSIIPYGNIKLGYRF